MRLALLSASATLALAAGVQASEMSEQGPWSADEIAAMAAKKTEMVEQMATEWLGDLSSALVDVFAFTGKDDTAQAPVVQPKL